MKDLISFRSRELFEAMQEALDIESGFVAAKRYQSVAELFADNNAEIDTERDINIASP